MANKFYYSEDLERFLFNCPGCGCLHFVITPQWQFNNDLENPTVSPSILVRGYEGLTEEQYQSVMNGAVVEPKPTVCHSFVRNGQIEFLNDCLHELSGQTVDLPDWD